MLADVNIVDMFEFKSLHLLSRTQMLVWLIDVLCNFIWTELVALAFLHYFFNKSLCHFCLHLVFLSRMRVGGCAIVALTHFI